MNLSTPAKKLARLIIFITIVFIVAGTALCFIIGSLTINDILPVSSGILLSSVICLVKVFSLEYQVSKLSSMGDPNKARFFAMGHGLLRFVLTGGGLVAAYFIIPFDENRHSYNPALISAIAGAFIYNIAVYALRFSMNDDTETAQADAKPDSNELTTADNNSGKENE